MLLALTGLLAMHGITASSASAALPCGQAPAHSSQHGHVMAEASDSHAPAIGDVNGASLAGTVSDSSHLGMLCLAVLVMALLIGLRRTTLRPSHSGDLAGDVSFASGSGSRAPPDDQQSRLCTWRT